MVGGGLESEGLSPGLEKRDVSSCNLQAQSGRGFLSRSSLGCVHALVVSLEALPGCPLQVRLADHFDVRMALMVCTALAGWKRIKRLLNEDSGPELWVLVLKRPATWNQAFLLSSCSSVPYVYHSPPLLIIHGSFQACLRGNLSLMPTPIL